MEGLGEPPGTVRLVEHDGLAAVVTDLAEPPKTRNDLDRHAKVQAAIVEQETIVPLRFGTLLDSEDELRSGLLGDHAAELAELLQSVDGRVQMTLKAVYHEDAVL